MNDNNPDMAEARRRAQAAANMLMVASNSLSDIGKIVLQAAGVLPELAIRCEELRVMAALGASFIAQPNGEGGANKKGTDITPPAIGTTITQRTRRSAHDYTLATIAPYTTKAGARSFVLAWVGHCTRCGGAFTQTTGRNPPRWMLRRCEQHRGRK